MQTDLISPMSHDAYLVEIVQAIFSTMLGLEVQRHEPLAALGSPLTSSIQITGAWQGTVVLGLSPDVAATAAATMLEVPREDVTMSDQHDVAAELVNMVGGNLKSVLPSPSQLSLPRLGPLPDASTPATAQPIDEIGFLSEVGQLRVALYRKNSGRERT